MDIHPIALSTLYLMLFTLFGLVASICPPFVDDKGRDKTYVIVVPSAVAALCFLYMFIETASTFG